MEVMLTKYSCRCTSFDAAVPIDRLADGSVTEEKKPGASDPDSGFRSF